MTEQLNYNIRIIDASETIPVRHPVLRPGKPIESCNFNGDDLETTFHLGMFLNHQIVGVVSYFKNCNDLLTESSQYQLRGMAVLEDFQGKGLGNLLVQQGDLFLKERHIKTLWCNAREVATTFYQKNNFTILGDPFNIKDIGLHYVMYKTLT